MRGGERSEETGRIEEGRGEGDGALPSEWPELDPWMTLPSAVGGASRAHCSLPPTHHSVPGRAALDGRQKCNVRHRGVHVFIHVHASGLYVLRSKLLDTALKISFNHMAVQLITTSQLIKWLLRPF